MVSIFKDAVAINSAQIFLWEMYIEYASSVPLKLSLCDDAITNLASSCSMFFSLGALFCFFTTICFRYFDTFREVVCYNVDDSRSRTGGVRGRILLT